MLRASCLELSSLRASCLEFAMWTFSSSSSSFPFAKEQGQSGTTKGLFGVALGKTNARRSECVLGRVFMKLGGEDALLHRNDVPASTS